MLLDGGKGEMRRQSCLTALLPTLTGEAGSGLPARPGHPRHGARGDPASLVRDSLTEPPSARQSWSGRRAALPNRCRYEPGAIRQARAHSRAWRPHGKGRSREGSPCIPVRLAASHGGASSECGAGSHDHRPAGSEQT